MKGATTQVGIPRKGIDVPQAASAYFEVAMTSTSHLNQHERPSDRCHLTDQKGQGSGDAGGRIDFWVSSRQIQDLVDVK